ncbi:MAG: chromosome partitioning protein ParB [Bacteroidetes bacterium 4484_276]|nr:MAG: chromosome partitioning protein ParB [Bacteroidetes bacterium 4484_276]OYT14047.1 MAG: chromosome partitioning protein ParB [Bacteroidetes bacterium 4572_114]
MKNKGKKSALGRGLEAILQSPDTDITSKDISGNYVVGAIANLRISKIEANPFQPRSNFEAETLEELANSIKVQGIIQPLTVRKLGYDKYQIIAGERRLRAARTAGLKEVPCYIRVANDEQMLEMALIENTHRQDLNAIEIAISYQRLIEECKITQEDVSAKVGKQRSTIANYIRLLKLPAEVQVAIRDRLITMGHARSFVNIDDRDEQLTLLKEILEGGLSVRQVEEKVRKSKKTTKLGYKRKKTQLPEKYIVLSKSLSEGLHTKVELKRNNKGKGSIVINFGSDEEMESLIAILKR